MLRTLSDEESNKILKSISETKVKITKDGELGGGAGHITGEMSLEVPRKFENSILLYSTAVHEIKHLIQFLKITNIEDTLLEKAFPLPSNIDTLYWTEEGAMRTEWEFISAIPHEYRVREFKQFLDE